MLEAAWEGHATALANATSPAAIAAILGAIWPVRRVRTSL